MPVICLYRFNSQGQVTQTIGCPGQNTGSQTMEAYSNLTLASVVPPSA